MSDTPRGRVAVVGAGPAGLTAAYELVKRGMQPLVLEKSGKVGGISRTETYRGYRFDIGGHRFFTRVPEVNALWHEVLGDEFLKVPRLSRIYYGGRFYDYPLRLGNTVRNLGPVESALILLSYVRAQMAPSAEEETFDQWVSNRFGRRLYRTFFKTYTEKVWGIPCSQIRADWAAQRIRGLSLKTAVLNALLGRGEAKSLIKEFDYPEFGPGQMWERFRDRVEEGGGEVRMNAETVRLLHSPRRDGKGSRIDAVVTRDAHTGEERTVRAEHFFSTMPLDELIARLDPAPPEEVRAAAAGLKYRDFLVVALILEREDLFPDNWVYIHSPDVQVGRIQNFKNWSAAMVPEPGRSCLGMEYFCNAGDGLWNTPDAELVALATREIGMVGLANSSDVVDGTVIRQPKAYPVYDGEYREHLRVLQSYLSSFNNFYTIGRNGMHRYNNQDHSMLTAILAVRNLADGERHDLWEVNTERSYHEDYELQRHQPRPKGVVPGGEFGPEGAEGDAPADAGEVRETVGASAPAR